MAHHSNLEQRNKTFSIQLLTLLPAKQHYITSRCELVVIVKFTKKYSHMLNAKHQSVVYINHKFFVKFLNAEYYKDIFMCWGNKLLLLNICIQYILKKKIIIANGLSWVIFNNANYSSDWLASKLAKEVFLH